MTELTGENKIYKNLDADQIKIFTELYNSGFVGCEPYWEDPLDLTSEVTSLLNDENRLFMLSQSGNGMLIAGSTNLSRFEGFPDQQILYEYLANDLYIFELAVDPAQRRKGTGESLVRDLINLASQRKFRGVTLRADLRNQRAIKLYSKLGFEVITEVPGSNPFDIYLRLGFSYPLFEVDVNLNAFSKLAQNYPLENYMFFVNEEEVENWRKFSGELRDVPVLKFDGLDWSENAGESEVGKAVWFIQR